MLKLSENPWGEGPFSTTMCRRALKHERPMSMTVREMVDRAGKLARSGDPLSADQYFGVGLNIVMEGAMLEAVAESMSLVNEELKNSRNVLEDVSRALGDSAERLVPLFEKQVRAANDVHATLSAMKDIRKFFLESDYEKEVKRLAEFVTLCERLQKLKEAGTLDALCDMAQKLEK